jgi:hypothetical protein
MIPFVVSLSNHKQKRLVRHFPRGFGGVQVACSAILRPGKSTPRATIESYRAIPSPTSRDACLQKVHLGPEIL